MTEPITRLPHLAARFRAAMFFPVACLLWVLSGTRPAAAAEADSPPHVLFVISDDQSWPHAGAYGYKAARTPAFDRIAREGVLFEQAFAPTPGCSPTRASILTGRNHWQIEHAGTHWSTFPRKYEVFPDRLEQAGYFIGRTGKGWNPGNQEGWERDPAGPQFAGSDYSDAFRNFLAKRPADQPFLFWFGAWEPHPSTLARDPGSGVRAGFDLATIEVPPFLPDVPEVRSHIADYLHMIEIFDNHLGRMIDLLEEAGELENTLVIVTSDHGMGFPRAKANLYEYGVRVPLAIRWGAKVPGGRTVADLVNLLDVTATIYQATGVEPPTAHPIAGSGLLGLLRSDAEDDGAAPTRDAVFLGRERHGNARHENLGYPMRAIRTHDHLLIRNFTPERWPAGAPQGLAPGGALLPIGRGAHAFGDMADGPAKTFIIENRDHPDYRHFLLLAGGKRPEIELFDIRTDPGCLHNLADEPAHANVRARLESRLENHLKKTGDPRVTGPDPGIFETYPRYGPIRSYPPPGDEPPEWSAFNAPHQPAQTNN